MTVSKNVNEMHGKRWTPEYSVWLMIKQRCLNPKCKDYKNYGARGITICHEWANSFSCFLDDMGSRPGKGYTVERKNNRQGYSKENCCWSTRKEQNRNKRNNRILTVNGISKTMQEWSEETGIPQTTISERVNYLGWSHEKAVLTPSRKIANPKTRLQAFK